MIPKIIHYCWFGNNPKDKDTLEYIKGWKKFLPDYEIREWTDADLNKIENKYVEEAYQNKKWAFVSDYVRLYALYNEGGIYFDTDVEVRKSFDEFLNLDFFIGSELYEDNKQIGTAVIGAKKESSIIARLLKEYDNIRFIKEDGKLDCTTNTQRLIKPLKELGFSNVYTDKEPIYLNSKNVIYPVQYFSKDAPESYAVHHFAASWIDDFKVKTKFSIKFNGKTIKLLKVRRNKQGSVFNLIKDKIVYSTNQNRSLFWVVTAEKGE